MHTLIIILHVIVSIFLVIVVLLQVGKGASIGSTFGGSSQALFGSAGPATFLSKITIACAAIFMLTSLYLTYLSGRMPGSSVMGGVPAVKSAPAAQTPQPGAPPGNAGQPAEQQTPAQTPAGPGAGQQPAADKK
ncbi:MAG: preprotein translocase subunit SecG [Deltaproteobacteria bacterium]|nr:preprotein translocase subunit SecG [Deltaproteobacteria bacterium]